MRGFRFPETLACSQPQWVFWAIRNYPENLHNFYIEPNCEMTPKRARVCAHVHACVIYVHGKVLYKSFIKNWHFIISGFWKFSLRLRKDNYAVWLNQICRISCVLIKCLLFQSSKIKIVLGSKFHELGFYNHKSTESLHRHEIYLTFSWRCFFNRTCQISLNFLR